MNNVELVESNEKILSRELLQRSQDSSKPAFLESKTEGAYAGIWKQIQIIVEAALERKKERVVKKQTFSGGLTAVGAAKLFKPFQKLLLRRPASVLFWKLVHEIYLF